MTTKVRLKHQISGKIALILVKCHKKDENLSKVTKKICIFANDNLNKQVKMKFITNKTTKKIAAKILLAATIFTSVSTGAEAQTMYASKSHYSTDNGLCSNAVSNIIQDD